MDERLLATIVFTFALLISKVGLHTAHGSPMPEDVQAEEPSDKTRLTIEKSTTHMVQEGDSLKIPCGIEGSKFALIWYKDGKNDSVLFVDEEPVGAAAYPELSVDKQRSLTISHVTKKTSGVYTCSADPTTYTDHTVGIKVNIVEFNVPKTAEAGKNVTLSCTAIGYPNPTVEWTRQTKSLSTLTEVIGRTTDVILPSIKVSDSGVYTCRAYGFENQTMSRTAHLEVYGGLQAEHEIVNAADNKELATLCCASFIENFERSLSWLKDGKPIGPPDGRVFVDFAGNKHKLCLFIKNVLERDLGTYTCRLPMPGNTYEHATIKLTGAPATPVLESVGLDENGKTPVIKWTVNTYSPVLYYDIQVRKEGDTEWMAYQTVNTLSTDKEEKIEQKFDNLPNGQYDVKLIVYTKLGSSTWTSKDRPLSVDKLDGSTTSPGDSGNSAAIKNYAVVSVSWILVTVLTILLC